MTLLARLRLALDLFRRPVYCVRCGKRGHGECWSRAQWDADQAEGMRAARRRADAWMTYCRATCQHPHTKDRPCLWCGGYSPDRRPYVEPGEEYPCPLKE